MYRRILGIEAPWYVDAVDLKLEEGEVHVRLAHHDMIDWPCPECGASCSFTTITRAPVAALGQCQYETICTPNRRGANAVNMGSGW